MKFRFLPFLCSAGLMATASTSLAETKVVMDRNDNEDATPAFKFQHVAAPRRGDAAAQAKFTVIAGEADRNSGGLEKLTDGLRPKNDDDPSGNFFFSAGTDGGRLLLDLGKEIDVLQINSYSWHNSDRGPQVYTLYASDGKGEGFNTAPKNSDDPEKCGWKLIARVDTRPKDGEHGGQYGVNVSNSTGSLGSYRYLLFQISRTENRDPFGNTFYSEIDVVDNLANEVPEFVDTKACVERIEVDGYAITVDTCETPDLTDWAKQQIVPMAREWYPKLAAMLPSAGFEAPKKVSIIFSQDMDGVAATGGTRIQCAAKWFRENLKGEATGAVFHELVHVIQHYGRTRRDNPNVTRPPGWFTEGMADYIRWFKFEPETHGAEITRRNLSRARYDASYRITANFLNWVTEKYDRDLVPQLNAAIREGRYSDNLWKDRTGHTVQELGSEWKAALAERLGETTAGESKNTR
jgi:hypothetical protein